MRLCQQGPGAAALSWAARRARCHGPRVPSDHPANLPGSGWQPGPDRHIPSCSGSCGLARNVKESPLPGAGGGARAGPEQSRVRGVVWMFYLLQRNIWGRWQYLGGSLGERRTTPSPSTPLHSCLRHKISFPGLKYYSKYDSGVSFCSKNT